MLTQFSEKAQKVIVIAESIAFDLGHSNVGSEHLLLSLIRIGNNTFATSLKDLGITANLIELDIIRLFGKKDTQPFYMEYTNVVRRIIDQSIKESRKRNEKKISVDSLCLGLLSISDSVAIELLNKYGVNIQMIKEEINENTKVENELDSIHELINLNKQVAQRGNIIIGREKQLNQLIEVLCRKEKNNAIVVGKAGVGKTALIEKLAIAINEGKVPEQLKNSIIYELDLSAILAGTKYRGEFEEKFKKIIHKICKHKECIVFIDEIHNLVGAGGAEGAIDASNMIKPYIARKQFTCIGATTQHEYYKFFEKDEALNRRFQYINLEPTSYEETVEIIKGLQSSFEKYHGVSFDEHHIRYLVRQAGRYFYTKNMPDKAIDLLDLVLVRAKMNNCKSIHCLDIDHMVEELMNMNFQQERISNLEKRLLDEIKGQDKAIHQIIQQLSLIEKGFYELNKPKLVSLFVGPTGVGKTQIAKLIAKYYFNDSKYFIKLDMSEYKEANSISKIIGASPGYIGYDEQTLLIQHITNHPRSVILLDEIEKAHPDVLNLFLQIFDEGVIKDQRGKSINFKESMIIMTSNVGYQYQTESIGFKKLNTKARSLEDCFSNEWLNRVDQIVYFNTIHKEAAKQIIEKQLDKFNKQLNINVPYSEQELDKIFDEVEVTKYGARAILRAVKQYMYSYISKETTF